MKRLFFLFLLSSSFIFANPKNPTKSSIKAITVFVDGAQVTRYSKITLTEGSTEFSFIKLSPFIQENSIQISGLAGVSILSINYAINHITKFDKTETIEQFQNNIETLNDKIQIEENLMEGYEQEIKIIEENRKLGNNNQVVNLDKLKEFASYYRKRITELNTLIHKSLKNKKEYNNQINDIKKQLAELNVNDKIQTGEIKVKLNSKTSKQLNLIIKYNVSRAGWFPIYDLKAKSINNPLELNYKAHVYQTTGVSWNNVKLTLSTNDPNTNNLKPVMDTKYLNFVSRYKQQNATKRNDFKHNPFVKHISGTITDANGSPLPGANIILKGTNIGTSTDFDGNYTIDAKGAKELEVSYIGYTSTTIPIHSSVINLSLEEDTTTLDEVVVAAYGTKKTSPLSGSVSGVTIQSASGQPRAGSSIKIRGVGTFNRNNQPLYVVDGIDMSENNFRNIHPDMIANLTVLKDASATKLYGSRASNGVIIVTTKKENFTSNGDIITEGISNTSFEIQKLSTIASDGDITVIEIDNFELPATFSYFTAPVINENVFLTAKIGNWQQLNLLPGEANIYFEDSYSGVTNINPYATTDSLTVSLGVDPNVVIKRKPTNNFKKTNFIGNNRIVNKSYEIDIKNNKTSAIDVVIVDRIPISQNKDIKVDDVETGNSDYNSKKGILTWKAKIESGISKKHQFSYAVKYPRYRKVNL